MTAKNKSTGKLYAFWSYDLYPYFLGAKVVRTFDDGSVTVEGYGNSKWKPPVLLIGNPGKFLLERSKKLRADLRAEERELHNRYLALLRDECTAQGADPEALKIPNIKE